MSGGLIKAKVDGTGYEVVPGGPMSFLRQELGIILEQNKNESIATAITKPEVFIATRVDKQNKASKKAGDEFARYMNELLEVGVPTETAKQTALLYAQSIYNAEMNIYEMANPGYAAAIGKHVVEREQKEGVRDLYLQDKAPKAYKKKVIKKYKARKAAKAANTPAQ